MKDENKLKLVTDLLSFIRVVSYILWGFVLGATAADCHRPIASDDVEVILSPTPPRGVFHG